MQRKNVSRFVLSILFVTAVLLPGQVTSAAPAETIQKEIQYETIHKDEKKDDSFPEKLTQDGMTYDSEGVSYEVVAEKPVSGTKTVTLTKKSRVLKNSETYTAPKTIDQDGVTYELKSSKEKKKILTAETTQSVSGYSQFDSLGEAKKAGQTKYLTVKDPKTGKSVSVACKKDGIQRVKDQWQRTYIDITFSGYDAEHFIWNSVIVKKDTKSPLKGYYKELVESVGGNEKDYKIKKIQWTGKAYKNKSGILCRKARASVLRRTPRYRVNYSGTRTIPAEVGKVITSTYEGQESIDTGEVTYTIRAKATYHLEKKQEPEKKTPVAVIMVGILLALILIVGILFILIKKKKKEVTMDGQTSK